MSALFPRLARTFPLSLRQRLRPKHLSTFEKVIIANSAIIVLDTVAGWWITQNNPETYHYLIDTTFIALAALAGLVVNFALLRAAFAPLRGVLATIRAIEQGDLEARVEVRKSDADALALARAFNAMLDRLALARDDEAAWVLRAQEEERRRLALELHDQTGQSLTALALHAEAIAQRLAGESSDAAAQARLQAERLTTLAQRTLAEVQSLSRQLRPPMLDDLGLPVALRWLAEDAGERLGVTVEVRVRGATGYGAPAGHPGTTPMGDTQALAPGRSEGVLSPDPSPRAGRGGRPLPLPSQGKGAGGVGLEGCDRLPDEVETTFFRIAQESLTNAVRHGQAQQVRVVLRQMATRVSLTVADDGRGFDLLAAHAGRRGRSQHRGLGLEGMAERARLLGGTLRVRTRPGRGCAVRVEVSFPPHSARASGPEDARGAHGGAAKAVSDSTETHQDRMPA